MCGCFFVYSNIKLAHKACITMCVYRQHYVKITLIKTNKLKLTVQYRIKNNILMVESHICFFSFKFLKNV